MKKLWAFVFFAGVMSGQVAPSGLIAEYRFTTCAGAPITNTTLPDCSGNGHDGTLTNHGGGLPTPTGKGITFAQQQTVDLPSDALSGMVTIQIVGEWESFAETSSTGYVFAYFGHATNAYYMRVNASNTADGRFGVCGFTGSAGGTYGFGAPWGGGASMCTVVLDATTDRVYLDSTRGVGYQFTLSHGNSGTPTTGVWQFGGSTGAGSYFAGKIFYAVVYNRALTDQEVEYNWMYISGVLAARGVTLHPLNSATNSQVVCLGDSLTNGTGSSSGGYCQYLAPSGTWDKWRRGITAATCEQIGVEGAAWATQKYAPSAPKSVAVLWCGTNNGSTQTPAEAYGHLSDAAAALRASGMRVILGTMISRTGNAYGGGTFDAWKNSYNALIYAGWHSIADGIADFAGTAVGADGAYSSAPFVDGVHLSDTGYANVIAPVAQAAINGLPQPGTALRSATGRGVTIR